MWPKVTKKEYEANERRTDAEVKRRVLNKYGFLCCERCGRNGKDDLRGLQISHTDEKGMGGTRRLYTAADKQLLCAVCHNTSADLHNLRETKVR